MLDRRRLALCLGGHPHRRDRRPRAFMQHDQPALLSRLQLGCGQIPRRCQAPLQADMV